MYSVLSDLTSHCPCVSAQWDRMQVVISIPTINKVVSRKPQRFSASHNERDHCWRRWNNSSITPASLGVQYSRVPKKKRTRIDSCSPNSSSMKSYRGRSWGIGKVERDFIKSVTEGRFNALSSTLERILGTYLKHRNQYRYAQGSAFMVHEPIGILYCHRIIYSRVRRWIGFEV